MNQKPRQGSRLKPAHRLSRGLVGCWLLNEGCGTTTFDHSLNGNHGSLENIAYPATATSGWNPGDYGVGVQFDGTDDRIDCGSDPVLDDLPAISWVLRVNLVGWGENNMGRPICKLKDATDMWVTHTGDIGWTYSDDAGVKYARSALAILVLNTWYDICITYDDDGDRTGRIYLDGEEVSYVQQDTCVGTRLVDAAGSLTIGQRTDGLREFNGMIMHAFMYNRRLTDAEVMQLHRDPYCMFR